MTTRLELSTRAYWAASTAIGRPQSVTNHVYLCETLEQLASAAGGKIGPAARRRLETLAPTAAVAPPWGWGGDDHGSAA